MTGPGPVPDAPPPASDAPTAAASVATGPSRARVRSHVCFRLELPLPLSLVPGAEVEDLWHALSHQVMREPTDLVAHTRRIILCRDRRLVHRLPGALADLQHTTGAHGRALRERLLRLVRHRLSPADREYFAAALIRPAPPPPREGRVLPSMARLHRLPGEGGAERGASR